MKKRILPLVCSALLMLTGCGSGGYQKISQKEAKEMMDTRKVLVLDVREQSEYNSGHIPGAVLLPVGTIDEDTAAAVIPEKDTTVLVSAAAAASGPPRPWPAWGIPAFMSSAGSCPGPTTL